MFITTLGLALATLACSDLTRPLDEPGSANWLLDESGPVTALAITAQAPDTILPPDSVPLALFDSLGTVTSSTSGIEPGPYRRDIVVVRFEPETPLAARMAALDSIAGRVVGGRLDPDHQNGTYYVRISGGTFDALVRAVTILQRQPQVANAFWWGLFVPDIQSHRRPDSGNGPKRPDRKSSMTQFFPSP